MAKMKQNVLMVFCVKVKMPLTLLQELRTRKPSLNVLGKLS